MQTLLTHLVATSDLVDNYPLSKLTCNEPHRSTMVCLCSSSPGVSMSECCMGVSFLLHAKDMATPGEEEQRQTIGVVN